MAKHTIEGNAWMTEKEQRSVRTGTRLVTVLCFVAAFLCIFGGVFLMSRGETDPFSMTEFAALEEFPTGVNVEISTAEEMAQFGSFVQTHQHIGVDYVLTNNVTLPESWTPVDLYDDFHGGGHTISGLRVSGKEYGGLFRSVGDCTIDDLTVSGTVEATICGGIAAFAETGAVLKNCINEADITPIPAEGERSFAGGLIGRAGDGCGENSSKKGEVHVIGCVNRGTVMCGEETAYDCSCGGIVGAVDRSYTDPESALRLDIEDCTNYGKVGGTFASGGILGSIKIDNSFMPWEPTTEGEREPIEIALSRTGIMRCTNYGTVEHQKRYNNSAETFPRSAWAGGIAGCTNAVLAVTECSNYGAVNLVNEEDNAIPGGILGGTFYDIDKATSDKTFGYASIYACANYGSSNAGYFGGMIGHNAGVVYLADSFSVGKDANGVCRTLGDITATEDGDVRRRGGFIARDVFNIVDASEIVDAYLINNPSKIVTRSLILDPVLRDDPSLIVEASDVSEIEPWVLRSMVTSTLLCYNKLFPVYSLDHYKAYTFSSGPGAEKWYAVGAASGSVEWNEKNLEGMVIQLADAQTEFPFCDMDEHIYMSRSRPDVYTGRTPISSDYDPSFFDDEIFGENAEYGTDLQNNKLYWGVRYTGSQESRVVLGQKLSLTVNLDGTALGDNAVVALMQKNSEGDYELIYNTVFNKGAFDAVGVLPGEYAVSVNGEIYPGTVVTVEENWQLPEAERDRFVNRKSLKLYTVEFCPSIDDTAVMTEIVARGGLISLPEETITDDGYEILGWSTKPDEKSPMDFSSGSIWDELDTSKPPLRFYPVLGDRIPAGVTVRKDGAYDPDRTVTLLLRDGEPDSGSEVSPGQDGTSAVVLEYNQDRQRYVNAETADGLYDVYIDDTETGVTLQVKNGCGSAVVNYYTVEFRLAENSDEPLKTVVVQERKSVTPPTDTYGKTVVGWMTKPKEPFDLREGICDTMKLYARTADPNGLRVVLNRDGVAWTGADVSVTLQSGNGIELLPDPDTGVYLLPDDVKAMLPDGAYNIYVNGADTRLAAAVPPRDEPTVVRFYTVTFYDGNTLVGETVVLDGDTVSAPTDMKNAPSAWQTMWFARYYDFSQPVTGTLKLFAVRSTSGGGDVPGGGNTPGGGDVPGGGNTSGSGDATSDGSSSGTDVPGSTDASGDSPESGELDASGEAETGSAEGTEALEPVYYAVSGDLENAELDGKEKVAPGKAYSAVIKPAENYMLPEHITVLMGDDDLKLTKVSYDSKTGEFSIPAGTVYGDITVSGSAVPIRRFAVKSEIANSILYGAEADSETGYRGTVVPNSGYKLPETITATVNDEPFFRFSYNAATGEIEIPASAINGDICFAGACEVSIRADRYHVTASIGHGKATVVQDSAAAALSIIITPDSGYACPDNLIILSGHKRFTDFSYDPLTGALSIGSGKVNRIAILGISANQSTERKVLDEKSFMPKS